MIKNILFIVIMIKEIKISRILMGNMSELFSFYYIMIIKFIVLIYFI
jgi:hypothetical protein